MSILPNCRDCGQPLDPESLAFYRRLCKRNGHDPDERGAGGILCAVCFWDAIQTLIDARGCHNCRHWDDCDEQEEGCCVHPRRGPGLCVEPEFVLFEYWEASDGD